MRKNEYRIPIGPSLLSLLLAAILLLAAVHNGQAEAARPVLKGDLALTGADVDLRVAECLRVDVKWDSAGAWADLTLPAVPPGIAGVMLFDGWHLLHGKWTQTGEHTLRLHFRADDLAKLDGTVGIYLVIIAGK